MRRGVGTHGFGEPQIGHESRAECFGAVAECCGGGSAADGVTDNSRKGRSYLYDFRFRHRGFEQPCSLPKRFFLSYS